MELELCLLISGKSMNVQIIDQVKLPTVTHSQLPTITHSYPHLHTGTTVTHSYPQLPTVTHSYPQLHLQLTEMLIMSQKHLLLVNIIRMIGPKSKVNKKILFIPIQETYRQLF